MKTNAFLFLFLVSGLLSCAAPQSENSSNSTVQTNVADSPKTPEATKTKTGAAPISNKIDACALLPGAEVGSAVGGEILSSDLSRVTEGTAATAAFSQCTYKTMDKQTIEFFARRSPVPDNTEEAIAKSRETMKGFSKKGLEDVSGLGKTAFWVPGMNQLHVFEGENIYFYFTMRGQKSEAEAKLKAAELARRAIDNLSVE